MMNRHEQFVEKLRNSFYEDIMLDERMMNNGQKNEKEDKGAKPFPSLDDLFGDDE